MSRISAGVKLAIAGICEESVASAGTFLSFPTDWIPVDPSALDALNTGATNRVDIEAAAALASTVDLVPDGAAWSGTGSSLWETYRDILHTASLAEAAPSAEERDEYERAVNSLYDRSADGLSIQPSPVLEDYLGYRQQCRQLDQAISEGDIAAHASTDSSIKDRWTEQRTRLTSELQALKATTAANHGVDWVDGVERELAALDLIKTKSGARIWSDWTLLCDDPKNVLTPEFLSPYPRTTYLPFGLPNGDWGTVSMDAQALMAMMQRAPSDYARLFDDQHQDPVPERLRFESATAYIRRPWFVPGLFSAGSWRLEDRRRVMSDGCDPPAGLCTAYVCAVIFLRRIVVGRDDGASHSQATDKLYLAAFVCQRLPRAPKPDPSLTWPAAPALGPVVGVLNPNKGAANTPITVTGGGLQGGELSVAFGGAASSIAAVEDDGQIVVTVPHLASPSLVQVTVETEHGASIDSPRFQYVVLPAIAGVEPSSGTAHSRATITGTGFDQTPTVTFDGVPASQTTRRDDRELIVTVPHLPREGPAGLRAATDAGSSLELVWFQYRDGWLRRLLARFARHRAMTVGVAVIAVALIVVPAILLTETRTSASIPEVVINAGTGTIPDNEKLDLDNGELNVAGWDVWWAQGDPTQWQMVPADGVMLSNLGHADFAALTRNELTSKTYSGKSINGSSTSSDAMTPGTVLAVHTSSNGYAKMEVVTYGNDLRVHWVTYR